MTVAQVQIAMCCGSTSTECVDELGLIAFINGWWWWGVGATVASELALSRPVGSNLDGALGAAAHARRAPQAKPGRWCDVANISTKLVDCDSATPLARAVRRLGTYVALRASPRQPDDAGADMKTR